MGLLLRDSLYEETTRFTLKTKATVSCRHSILALYLCSKRLIAVPAFQLHEVHCRRHLTLCPQCKEPVPTQDMDEHYAEYHAPTSCDLCGASIPKDQLEEHMVGWCVSLYYSMLG